MHNRGQLIIGGVLVFLGISVIASNLFQIDLGAICWPSAFILLGIWLILRPRLALPGSEVNIQPLCSIRRSGPWTVNSEEIWMFVGDVKLDFTQTEIPTGETSFRIYGFVGNVTLILPQDADVSISASALVNDAKIFGKKQDIFLTGLQYDSPNYQNAERKIRLETFFFVCDLDLIQG